jgi:hypothetical protein
VTDGLALLAHAAEATNRRHLGLPLAGSVASSSQQSKAALQRDIWTDEDECKAMHGAHCAQKHYAAAVPLGQRIRHFGMGCVDVLPGGCAFDMAMSAGLRDLVGQVKAGAWPALKQAQNSAGTRAGVNAAAELLPALQVLQAMADAMPRALLIQAARLGHELLQPARLHQVVRGEIGDARQVWWGALFAHLQWGGCVLLRAWQL